MMGAADADYVHTERAQLRYLLKADAARVGELHVPVAELLLPALERREQGLADLAYVGEPASIDKHDVGPGADSRERLADYVAVFVPAANLDDLFPAFELVRSPEAGLDAAQHLDVVLVEVDHRFLTDARARASRCYGLAYERLHLIGQLLP